MTEIETKIISTEIIKPYSPTPKSLQKHQLSFLDQIVPPITIPLVYFYPPNSKTPNSENLNHLKKSLSETLSRFYPLAGRIVDNLYVDCNDRGAPFAEAEANCDLSRVITDPDPERIKKLLFHKWDESQDFCMSVQATYFRCGGLALGLLITHKIADALSSITFANTWSAVARNGGDSVPCPKFNAASYFPPSPSPSDISSAGWMQEEVAPRILTFPAARIAALQERYATASHRPSRVAALSAYLWTRLKFDTGKQADPTKIYCMLTSINVRSLVNPPMSEYHIGNIVSLLTTMVAAGDGGAEVVQKLLEAKKAMQDGRTGVVKAMDEMNELSSLPDAHENVDGFFFSSLCGFSLYEADFGWGKPVWVVLPGLPYENIAIFTDTKSGGGIQVILQLSKQDMDKFEGNLELDNN